MTHKYTTELSNSYSFNNLQRMLLPAFTLSLIRGSSQRMPIPSQSSAGHHSCCLVVCWFIFVAYVKLDHQSEPRFCLWFVSKNPRFIPRPGDQLFRLSLLIILQFFTCIRHRLFLWIPAGGIFIFFKMAIRALGPTQLLIQWRAEFIALLVQLSRPETARSPPSTSEVRRECRGI
jgi:hypothetical protein